MKEFLNQLSRRNPALFWFGCFNLALLVIAFVMYFVDETQILGISAWIKPLKFAQSITIYSWTFAWMLGYVEDSRAVRRIAFWVIVTMTVEIVLIYLQAFRGTTSHFNIRSAFDIMVFNLMGIFIMINTIINLYALWVFCRRKLSIAGTDLLAWRSGLIIFCAGAISGGWMVAQMSHTIGAPDGGPGLPFLNWSTVAGDVRAAHFAALHALQVIPISVWLVRRIGIEPQKGIVAAIIAGYGALCLFLHVQAWMQIPLFSL